MTEILDPYVSKSRVLFVCSAGGHLRQLVNLAPWYRSHEVRWVTFESQDSVSLLPADQTVWAYQPTTRNLRNLCRNSLLAWREIRLFRPQLIVSSGAGVAVPFFWIGKLLGSKTIYIEVIDRTDTRTLTARLVSPVTDLLLVQDSDQVEMFPGSHMIGGLL
jgi:beta-1,4-N-acetylglucosaminyltransferase